MKTIYQRLNLVISNFSNCAYPLIIVLLLFAGKERAYSQTSFSFTEIPFADPDFIAPHRGTEEWMVMNQVNIPIEGTYTHPMDAYYRFEWTEIETAKGVYNWTSFDAAFKRAIDKGQKFSFGIMPLCSNCTGSTIDGAKLTYPSYLHYEMQTESVKDWIHNGIWIPNWNSNYYLIAWENMLKAVATHMNTTYINNVKLSSIVNYIDIRGYGNWGEWHNYPYGDVEPTANRATANSLLRILNAHKIAFPDIRLITLSDAFDVSNWSRVPAEVGYALLTGSNNVGEFGWRRDNWGDPAFWFKNKLENNTTTFNGRVFSEMIMNKWKNAPIVGEPSSCCTINGGSCQYWELETQIRRYHTLSFGNGNIEASSTACVRDNIRKASKAAGYRLVLAGGSMTTNLVSGSPFMIQMNWQNKGITPTYEKWDVIYQLRNSSNLIVWSGTSTFKPSMFLPQLSATTIQDNFNLPATIQTGTYNLVIMVVDPANYRRPLPLAINGRNTDGSYLIRSVSITQGTIISNKPPVANAGVDQIITLPTNTTTLNGSQSTDPEGGSLAYKWSQVGGPSQAFFTNNNQVTATVNNLLQGIYQFRLTVYDGAKDSAYDDISVTVNADPSTLIPPIKGIISDVKNATCYGAANGSLTVTVTGGTAPYTYAWNTSPIQTSSTARNLTAGSYTVTIIDSLGKSGTTTGVITQPDKLVLTVAAGTITTYGGTTTVSLNATGGTPSYVYQGPTTNVSAGTYTYVVLDANSCSDSKTITIDQPPYRRIKKRYRYLLNGTNVNSSISQSFSEIPAEKIIQLFPNPVREEVNVQMNNEWAGKGIIQIFNVEGISVKQEFFTKPSGYYQLKINTAKLTSGMYIMLIQNSEMNFQTIKFIKQ